MRLSEFIRNEKERLLEDWETFARTLLPAASGMNPAALRDHAEKMIDAIATDMEQPQSGEQQTRKSRGKGGPGGEHGIDAMSLDHAGSRLEEGFDLNQMVSEYRALRASVIRLWAEHPAETKETEGEDLTRFNEAIDQALAEAVRSYTEKVNRYRDQFLGILGHDLRNPLGAITASATFLTRAEDLGEKYAKSAVRILNSALRMNRMVGVLLDLTRIRLGTGLPIAPGNVELRGLCQTILGEIEASHPDRLIRLEADREVRGVWDSDRLSQAVSNLVGNALQHGAKGAPVTVRLRDEGPQVVLEVHNEGAPIPERAWATLFEPMRRLREEDEQTPSGSLGLGLYIVREVVNAHGGKVELASSEGAGTTFTVHLPREAAPSGIPHGIERRA